MYVVLPSFRSILEERRRKKIEVLLNFRVSHRIKTVRRAPHSIAFLFAIRYLFAMRPALTITSHFAPRAMAPPHIRPQWRLHPTYIQNLLYIGLAFRYFPYAQARIGGKHPLPPSLPDVVWEGWCRGSCPSEILSVSSPFHLPRKFRDWKKIVQPEVAKGLCPPVFNSGFFKRYSEICKYIFPQFQSQ